MTTGEPDMTEPPSPCYATWPVFNVDDERYLPFEGTGAISRWTLSFSNPAAQRDMIDSITDIIVHMRYTAKSR